MLLVVGTNLALSKTGATVAENRHLHKLFLMWDVRVPSHIEMIRLIKKLVCIPLLVCAAVPLSTKAATELDLIMPVLGVDRVIAERIVELVKENSGLEINLVPLPDDSVSALDALEAGYGDIAFAPNTGAYREGISTVIPLYPSILHIIAHAERPAGSLAELLRGARVYAGPRESFPRTMLHRIADSLEFEPGEFTIVDERDAATDVIVLYAPIDRDRVLNELALERFRWFSLGDPDDIGNGSLVDLALLMNPRLRRFVIPVGTFGKLTPEPILTVAVDNVLVARTDLDVTVVYDIYDEILRLRPALFSSRPELYQPIDENIANTNFAYSLHPGALAFLKRDEPSFIERYSGVAEVIATLFVGLASGVFAFVRIYHVRRKNRLDEFLVQVIGIRNSVHEESSADERTAAVAGIRALQDEAYELLVDEKLAADESFRIFIELSTDTVKRIRDRKT